MKKSLFFVGVIFAVFVSPAFAGETITYSYDALGRLTTAVSTGSVNNNASRSVGYDAAGNRSSDSVTGGLASRSLDRNQATRIAQRSGYSEGATRQASTRRSSR